MRSEAKTAACQPRSGCRGDAPASALYACRSFHFLFKLPQKLVFYVHNLIIKSPQPFTLNLLYF